MYFSSSYSLSKAERLAENGCPIDHSMDSEVVSSYYKVVKKYSLPWSNDTYLETVHK